MAEKEAKMLERGNIDLDSRPVVNNSDGSFSTVKSMSVNIDGKEVLIPTISPEGKELSPEQAVALYRQTGKHLGVYSSPEEATKAAKAISKRQGETFSRRATNDLVKEAVRTSTYDDGMETARAVAPAVDKERPAPVPKEKAKPGKIDITKVIEDARNGDEDAVQVINHLARLQGVDGDMVFKQGNLSYTDPATGKLVPVTNLGEFKDQLDNDINLALELKGFGGKTKQAAPKEEQKPKQAVDTRGGSVSAGQRASEQVRKAIPMGYDELDPKEQDILHRALVTRAAYTGKTDDLDRFLDGPIDRDVKKASADYYRARANAKAAPAEPEYEYEYLDDVGTVRVIDKNTKQRLWALGPDRKPMPLEFADKPGEWQKVLALKSKQLSLRDGDQLIYNAQVNRFGVRASDGKFYDENGYVNAVANGNLGTVKTSGSIK